MSMDTVKEWLGIFNTLLALGAIFYAWVSREGREAHAEVKIQREKIEKLEDRVAKLEGEIAHLPDKDTAHRMEMAIARLEGRLETMDERLKPVASMAARMQDYMLENAK